MSTVVDAHSRTNDEVGVPSPVLYVSTNPAMADVKFSALKSQPSGYPIGLSEIAHAPEHSIVPSSLCGSQKWNFNGPPDSTH